MTDGTRAWTTLLTLVTAVGAWGIRRRGSVNASHRRNDWSSPDDLRHFIMDSVFRLASRQKYMTAGDFYDRVSVSITGTNTVRSFTGTTHRITNENGNEYPLPSVRVKVRNPDWSDEDQLPIDCHPMQEARNLGFTCRVITGLAAHGAEAECSGNQLPVGKKLKLKLVGGTTFVLDQSAGRIEALLYPDFPSEDGALTNSYHVAINPS